MCEFLCGHICFSSGFFLGAKLLGHVVTLCLTFKGPSDCLPNWPHHLTVLLAMHEAHTCHYILVSECNFIHPSECKVNLPVISICIALKTNGAEVFPCAYWPFVCISIGEMSMHSLCPFFKLGCVSFYYWVERVVYSTYKSFFRYTICKYCFPIHGLPFHLPDNILRSTGVFNFQKAQFYFFSFVSHAFLVISKSPLCNQRQWRFTTIYDSKSFIFLTFPFRYLVHFEQTCVNCVRGRRSSSFFRRCYLVLLVPFDEKTIFPTERS